MKRLACLPALLLATTLFGCHMHGSVSGSGVRKTEKRELASFNAIHTTGAFDVEVVTQKPASFEIEADDNILPLIQTEVRDSTLYLMPTSRYNSRQGVVVRVTLPDLSKLEATGAGNFRVAGLKNDNFEIHTTGAATVTAAGETKNVEIHTTGAGVVDTHKLRAVKADVRSTGAAKVDVYASEQLDVSASGVGAVTYSGDPKVNKHTSGAASVSKRENEVY
jgi:Putative auto-transporter adhesin, head GIN domain